MIELFLQYAAPPVLTALGLGVAWLLTTAGQLAMAKWKDSKIAIAVERVTHFAGVVVQDIEATMRPEVQTALKDGHLSPSEAQHLKAVALERLKTMLGQSGLRELTGVVGVFAPSLDAYLSGVIEKQVARLPTPS